MASVGTGCLYEFVGSVRLMLNSKDPLLWVLIAQVRQLYQPPCHLYFCSVNKSLPLIFTYLVVVL